MAWKNRFAGPSVIARWLPPGFKDGLDPDSTEGAIDLVYDVPNFHVNLCGLNLRVSKPGFGGASGHHTMFSSPKALSTSLRQPQNRMRSPIGEHFSTNRPAQKPFSILPPKRPAGDSLCPKGSWPWRRSPIRIRQLLGAGCRGRGFEGWQCSCPPRCLCGRLRHRGQSRYGPGADSERGHSLASRPHSMARLRLRMDVLSKQTSIVTKCCA